MNFFSKNITASAFFTLLSPALLGAPVSVGNFSFEADRNNQDAVGSGFASGQLNQITPAELTSWRTLNPTLNSNTIGVGSRHITPPHGNGTQPPQALSLKSTEGGAAIYQLSSLRWNSLAAGGTLTLTVAAGRRNNDSGITWAERSFFGLTDGSPGSLPTIPDFNSTVANSGFLTTDGGVPTDGSMADFTVTHTVQAADLNRSGEVGILIAGASTSPARATQSFFDNVRLDYTPPSQEPSRPNLVFLFLDDMRWDAASFTGNQVITTPNMDILASEGTIFENAFATTAICMVSRASVFMGQHMARHGIDGFGQNLSASKWENSYPDQLDEAGYYMGFIGKQGLGRNFIGLYGTYDFDKSWEGQGNYFGQTIDGEPANGRHITKFVGDLAVEFVEEATGSSQNPAQSPFCLQISFKAPHVLDTAAGGEFQNDPAFDNLYADDTITRAKTDTQAQFDDLPTFLQGASTAGTQRASHRFGTEARFQENVKKHHRLIHGVDVQIGRILDALSDPNNDGDPSDSVRDNTVIILSSDHGFFLNERRQAGKWYIQEESIRIPLVVSDPRLPASLKNKRVPEMALNIDISATLLDYAGATIPTVMQGRSLRPIVEGQTQEDWRTNFFHDHPNIGSVVFDNEGVRTESFVYTRYPSDGNFQQLYDITVDPYQRTNLADDPRYATKLNELDALTSELKSEAN